MNHARLIHLVAHRGNAGEFPENTLPAFTSALEFGLRFLELDVHISADGIPVVIHDHDLIRTTGRPGCVFDLRARELALIDAGEPERFGDRFAGTRIPLLRDVVALLERRPEVTLFVEIKRASLMRFGHDQVVTRVVDALKPARAQCVVISFDLPAVHRVRQFGAMPIGWVVSAYDAAHAPEVRGAAARVSVRRSRDAAARWGAVARSVALGGVRGRVDRAGAGARGARRRITSRP